MKPNTFTQIGLSGGFALGARGGSVMRVVSSVVSRTGTVHSLQDTLSLSTQPVPRRNTAYTVLVPRLWNETIEGHRREVRQAILDTTVALVAEHGLLSVTMSQIAEETGIGRATLYKYFPDVEAILRAWHERQIAGHLAYLAEVRDKAGDAGERLAAVLEAYAVISHDFQGRRDTELGALLHRDTQVVVAETHLRDMVRDLLVAGARRGDIRDDIDPGELANYCLHALTAASSLPSKAALHRLVEVTLAGLRPQVCSGRRSGSPSR